MAIHLWKKSHLDVYLLNQCMCDANLGNLLVRLKESYWKLSFFSTSGKYDSHGNIYIFKTASEFIFNPFLIKMISYISEGLMWAYVLIKCNTAIAS